jgi:hypothetical protein
LRPKTPRMLQLPECLAATLNGSGSDRKRSEHADILTGHCRKPKRRNGMTTIRYSFNAVNMMTCVAVAFTAACCTADDQAGPTLSQPQVDRSAEFVAPPLVLPAAKQNDAEAEFAIEPPAEIEAPQTPTAVAPALNPPLPEHRVQMHVEAEVVAPPAPVRAAPSQAVYEPIYKELPVTNHIMHVGARRFARCHRGMMHAKLEVTNPADCKGCYYWVSAKVPACCEGEPSRSGRVGILGRGVVEYRWSCGWTVKVVFRTRGDVVLHYMAG